MSATTSGPLPRRTPSNWNIANGLTLLRIALVPLFIVLLLQEGGHSTAWRIGAALAFAAAIATDRIDGELARSWDLITDFGKIADPIADKALVGAALISLSALGELWWWVTVLILARELGITLLRFLVIRYGVIPAGRGGKLKTAVQALAILLLVLPMPHAVRPIAWVVMALALVLTLVSGADYITQALRLRARGTRSPQKPTVG